MSFWPRLVFYKLQEYATELMASFCIWTLFMGILRVWVCNNYCIDASLRRQEPYWAQQRNFWAALLRRSQKRRLIFKCVKFLTATIGPTTVTTRKHSWPLLPSHYILLRLDTCFFMHLRSGSKKFIHVINYWVGLLPCKVSPGQLSR